MRSRSDAEDVVPRPAATGSPGGPIVLVGVSGAGKTVVGRLLAARLAWSFIDLDEEVERIAGCSIADIFARQGERAFRDLESQVTHSTRPDPRTVVSTGGGWMARPELRESWPGAVRVWLRVEPSSAVSRLARERSSRPLLADPDPETALESLLSDRRPAYQLAEVTVRTDALAPDAVVDAILDGIASAGPRPATP
jgi:shikimate kinase